MTQPDAWRIIRLRAVAAGIAAPIGCHTFRAKGITAYLANGGRSSTFDRLGVQPDRPNRVPPTLRGDLSTMV